MNVIDSSAWLSYFADEKRARPIAELLGDFTRIVVPSITLTEVFKSAARQRPEQHAMRAVAQMMKGRVVALDADLAIAAAEYGLEFRLPLADSIIYATTRKYDALLWTHDVDFKDLPGVKFFA